mmetsp:Transcript_103220/g.183408  ORF Transcript_103220/g.183408 Transcript_103220/m.183408 type:complete len:1222 (-) Transcript_103220:237-3902(-)|eukprot:CAMPEP_0197622842 /NCGR_PEP_ID=MMETSP1338-20131121/2968_1 /TAXON_ID=43686 ORGANISM="Pelagodinium beii, Strain RCC1491" /NCGR_SAMPLE_ID=MMETSP1338 /ASSEMBLY_ACC=CAM_ASM_000754 /LENGTH=1221 /DNA_ID=CAMNT_0043192605 /DNA_START=16 /DNA_END=3681 /DNA_ORIENTATION=+
MALMWHLLGLLLALAVSTASSSCTEGECSAQDSAKDANDAIASFLQVNQKLEEVRLTSTAHSSKSSSSFVLETVLVQLAIVAYVAFLARSSREVPKQQDDETPPAEKNLTVALPPPGVDANDDPLISNAGTFVDILEQKAKNESTKNQGFAHIWDLEKGLQQTLSYHEFAIAVSTGAANMLAAGVHADERLAFLAKGSPHFFVALLSSQVVGATPVLLNWRQPEPVLLGCIKDTNATTLVKGAPYHDMGSKLADDASEVLRILAFNDGGDVSLTTALGKTVNLWKWSKTGEMKNLNQAGKGRKDEAVIFFTSGSTGQPKPVLHTYSTLIWTAQNFIYPPNAELSLAFLPNFHVIQTVQNFLIPLARGLRVAIHGSDETAAISSNMILKAAEDLKPDVIDTVPFIMAEWSELDAEKLKPLAKVKHVQSGGAPLSVQVAERLTNAGVNARTHYGQTEAPGIQLVTMPGAKPSELSLFLPPWPCASVSLKDTTDGVVNENADKGELIIRGIGGSSPGYLKDGVLRVGSSRMDAEGRHSTSDVFCWVTASNGTRVLKHCMRTDDVILLNTGEMFNPVQMENSMLDYGLKVGLKTTHSIVLGAERAAPFLVMVLAEDEKSSAEDALKKLQPGLDEANDAEVEYARIKKGHFLVLAPGFGDEKLPTSIKGNVVRKQAEDKFSSKLDEMGKAAEAAAFNAVDWDALRKEAEAAGYDDLQKYLAAEGSSRMAELGVDSLGMQSAAGNSEEVQEANRAIDNINAWMAGTVLLCHWYMQLGFWAMDGTVTGIEGAIQTQMIFALSIDNTNGFGVTMSAFLFALGWGESTRKVDGKVNFFDERLSVYAIILFLRKVIIMPLVLLVTQWGCQAANTWFFYSLIMGKATTCMMQYLTMPRAIKVTLAFLPVLANTLFTSTIPGLDGTSTGEHNMMLVLPGGSVASASWLDALFSPHSYVGLRDVGCPVLESACNDMRTIFSNVVLRTCSMSWSCQLDHFIAFDWVVFAYIFPFVLGFEYGSSFQAWCKKALPFPGKDMSSMSAWMGAPLLMMPFVLQWMYLCLGDTMSHASGVVAGLWQLASTCLVFFLVVAVSNIVPWRAKRMGGSALGLFILPYTIIWINDGWVMQAVVSLSKFHSNPTKAAYAIALEAALLVGWVYLFGYIFGPFLQQCVLSMVNFSRWFLTLFISPVSGLKTAGDKISNLPATTSSYAKQYMADLADAFYIKMPPATEKK